MMHISRSKKVFIFFALCSLAVCVAWYFLFMYIKDKVQKTAALEAVALEEATYQDRSRSLQTLVKDVAPDMEKLSSRIVASDGTASFITTIETLGKDMGISITTQSVGVTPSKEDKNLYENIQLIFSAKGSWSNLYHFLTVLESLPYKLTVDNVSFSLQDSLEVGAKKSAKSQMWNSAFTIHVLKHK